MPIVVMSTDQFVKMLYGLDLARLGETIDVEVIEAVARNAASVKNVGPEKASVYMIGSLAQGIR